MDLPQNLPHDPEAERAILGAVLLDDTNRSFVIASGKLRPDHPYIEAHQIIWQACISLQSNGAGCDLVTVTNQLRSSGNLERVGGASYLSSLVDTTPDVANVEHYCGIVREHAANRSLIAAAHKTLVECASGTKTATEASEALQSELQRIAGDAAVKNLRQISEPAKTKIESLERGDDTAGLKTGFHDLDRQIGGLKNNRLYVVGARTSVGKTAFALSLAVNVASKQGVPVAFFSLEQSEDDIASRVIASVAGVDLMDVTCGRIQKQDFTRIAMANQSILTMPLFVDDSRGLTPLQIGSKARQMQQEYGIGLVVIDYAQMIRSESKARSEYERLSGVVVSIFNLASEIQAPILLLSQLSREADRRGRSKELRLSDIKGTGSFEENADCVMFLQRDEVDKHIVKLIIAKYRQGPTGVVELLYEPHLTRFSSLERDREEPGW